MNTYDAMLAAADHIAQNPHLYHFMQGAVPPPGLHPACMLARLGQFCGVQPLIPCEWVAEQKLGVSATEFYREIARLHSHNFTLFNRDQAQQASAAMRNYAKRHLDPVTGIPAAVRQIFEPAAVVEPL